MREGGDGLPMVGATARHLGVRPGADIRILYNGSVSPGQAGMSVSPSPPQNLPSHRRPPELGGTGKDLVFEMDTEDLPEELEYRPDRARPDTHGFITPAYTMLFEHYQQAVHSTRALWWLV